MNGPLAMQTCMVPGGQDDRPLSVVAMAYRLPARRRFAGVAAPSIAGSVVALAPELVNIWRDQAYRAGAEPVAAARTGQQQRLRPAVLPGITVP